MLLVKFSVIMQSNRDWILFSYTVLSIHLLRKVLGTETSLVSRPGASFASLRQMATKSNCWERDDKDLGKWVRSKLGRRSQEQIKTNSIYSFWASACFMQQGPWSSSMTFCREMFFTQKAVSPTSSQFFLPSYKSTHLPPRHMLTDKTALHTYSY